MDKIAGRGWTLVAVAALIGTILRLLGIEAKSLWGDEIVTLTVSMGHSWYPWQGEETELFYGASHYRDQVALAPTYYSGNLSALLRMNDQMPPLYYVLLNLWLHLFGTSEAALRSLSLVANVATIPLVYLLGRALSSQRVGTYSAWILALAPFQIAFAVYNRPYAWLSFFAVLSTLAAVHLSRGRGGRWAVIYAVAAACGLYTHYLFAWNLLFQVLLVTVSSRHDRRSLLRFGLVLLAVGTAFLFWVPSFLSQVLWSREFGHQSWFYWYAGKATVVEVATSLARNLALLLTPGRLTAFCDGTGGAGCRLDNAFTIVLYAIPLFVLGLCAWALLQHVRAHPRGAPAPDPWATCLLWAGCVFLGPVVSDALLNSHMVNSHRYFIAASGPVYVAVAMAIVGTPQALRRIVGAGFLLFLLAGSVLYLQGSARALMYEIAARDVARYVDGRSADSSDLVLLLDPGINPMDFAYYLRSNPDFARVHVPERHRSVPDVPTQLQTLTGARHRDRIWYVDDRGYERQAHHAVLAWLRAHYLEIEAKEFTNVGLFLFSPRTGPQDVTPRE